MGEYRQSNGLRYGRHTTKIFMSEERPTRPTNPYGANQWTFDPRQKLCWESYTNPKSETFGNATQSAIKAGYTDEYANDITSTEWFRVSLWRLNATFAGEKKMQELIEADVRNGGDKIDIGLARIQADLAKFLASTQGKDKGYTTKTETDITTGGKALPATINIIAPHGSNISTLTETVGSVATPDGQDDK